MVLANVRVEIGPPGVDHDFPQQSGRGELMQRIVDGGQRHADALGHRLAMQLFGRDVPVPSVEQQPGQRQALTRRPQSCGLQSFEGLSVGPG